MVLLYVLDTGLQAKKMFFNSRNIIFAADSRVGNQSFSHD